MALLQLHIQIDGVCECSSMSILYPSHVGQTEVKERSRGRRGQHGGELGARVRIDKSFLGCSVPSSGSQSSIAPSVGAQVDDQIHTEVPWRVEGTAWLLAMPCTCCPTQQVMTEHRHHPEEQTRQRQREQAVQLASWLVHGDRVRRGTRGCGSGSHSRCTRSSCSELGQSPVHSAASTCWSR